MNTVAHYEYHKATSLQDAWRKKAELQNARFIAGGTDLLVQIRNGKVAAPDTLISLRSIPELTSIVIDDGLCIGAMATMTDILADPYIRAQYPALCAAARIVGSQQIQNVATLGGNLCNASPAADSAVPLLVLDARLRLESKVASRDVGIEEFFVGPGKTLLAKDELLTQIHLPTPAANSRAVFMRKGRVKMDLAMVSVCVLVQMDGKTCTKARVAAGAVAPVPLRLHEVEKLLAGRTMSRELCEEAGQLASAIVSPISDLRSSASYRRSLVAVFVKRALHEAAALEN